ncbi:TPA: hypothetical protein DDZ86_00275 [Candidatus Dependentiae bacterium]|nr:MAG: General secretion pathway protein G [candidate division TM6 bacterium GW2011_GWF2_43_87]HBL98064.1 hypothetical protein [Candidatus Dependentiae bacterium]
MEYTQIRQRRDRATGMTLIEIAIGLLIIGLVIAMIIPQVTKQLAKAKRLKTETVLRGVKTAIESYRIDTATLPATVQDLITRPSDPKVAARWKEPYLNDEIDLIDGWSNPIVYQRNAPGQRPPYKLYSWGRNGEGSPQDEWVDAESV